MPRAVDKTTGARTNLPRPPGATARGTLPRPAVSPTGSGDIRARKGEVVRPAPPAQAPSHTKPYVGQDGRMVEQIPRPPEMVETAEEITPDGGRKVREKLQGAHVAEEFKQEKQVAEMREATMGPEGPTEPPPPKKVSPLGDASPIEQALKVGPMPAGREQHLRAIGIDEQMTPEQAKVFEAQAVRDFERFGPYDGDDDPNAPPPPIRPGKNSYNPRTGTWLKPEGKVSMLDRLTNIQKSRQNRPQE